MRKKIIALLKNNFFQGGMILIGVNFIGGFINYLFNSLTAKSLGPARYGEITALFSYVTVFSIPANILSTEIIRRLGSSAKERIGKIFQWELWFFRGFRKYWWFVIPYFASLIFLPILTNLSLYFSLVLLVILLATFLGVFYGAALQGLHLFLIYTFILLLGIALKFLGALTVYAKIGSLDTIGFFLMLSSILPVLFTIFYFKKKYRNQNIHVKKISIRENFFDKNLVILALSLISVGLLNNLDMILIKKYFSPEEAGLYGAWNLLAKIIFYVIGPLTNIAFIFFSAEEKKHHHKKVLNLMVLLYLLMGLFLAVIYYFFGRQIILLIFSSKYLVIGPQLLLAAFTGVLYSLVVVVNNYFLAVKSKGALLASSGIIFYLAAFFFFGQNFRNTYLINFYSLVFCFGVYALFWLNESR